MPSDDDKVSKPNRRRNHSRWRPSPNFWNTLSTLHLSRHGLQEFDRRVAKTEIPVRRPIVGTKARPLTRATRAQLQQLAQNGGPDLTHLRGFTGPSVGTVGHSKSVQNDSKSVQDDSVSVQDSVNSTTSSWPYTLDVEQKLADNGVFHEYNRNNPASVYSIHHAHRDSLKLSSKPANTREIEERLHARRPSLSPSKCGRDQYDEFDRLYCRRQAGGYSKRKQYLMLQLEGDGHEYHCARDTPFAQSFAEDLPCPEPDSFDGALRQQIDSRVRSDLKDQIMPTRNEADPVAPNFITRFRPRESGAKEARHTSHYGAFGARAMHALQNYGEDTPVYDDKAYSFSVVVENESLHFYAHRPVDPLKAASHPEYHMSHVRQIFMGWHKDYRKALMCYRNLRDYAKEMRDTFIHQANERASGTLVKQAHTSPQGILQSLENADATQVEQPDISSGVLS